MYVFKTLDTNITHNKVQELGKWLIKRIFAVFMHVVDIIHFHVCSIPVEGSLCFHFILLPCVMFLSVPHGSSFSLLLYVQDQVPSSRAPEQ